jgi:anti-sigma-K factor RskA
VTDDDQPPEPDDVTAAELVLGLLEGDERAAALRRVLAEPAFARAVETWRAHFALLYDAWPEAAPPADGLVRLDRALDAPQSGGNLAYRVWQGLAVAAMAVAACLAVVLVTRPAPAPLPAPTSAAPTMIAQLAPVAPGTPIAATYDPSTRALRIANTALAQAGHSIQLWVIGADGVPHSIGLLNDGGSTSLALGQVLGGRLRDGVTLAISTEPQGGSPTGLPTGPVVAKGTLTGI